MQNVYLLLGSNLGDRATYLRSAVDSIYAEIGEVAGESSVYETASWGNTQAPAYLNQVVWVRSDLGAENILEKVLQIEKKYGRERIEKWGARTLDIDILFCDDQIVNKPNLIIPHPYLHLRRFTLAPLNELIPDFMHPVLKKSINELYCSLFDNLTVNKITP